MSVKLAVVTDCVSCPEPLKGISAGPEHNCEVCHGSGLVIQTYVDVQELYQSFKEKLLEENYIDYQGS